MQGRDLHFRQGFSLQPYQVLLTRLLSCVSQLKELPSWDWTGNWYFSTLLAQGPSLCHWERPQRDVKSHKTASRSGDSYLPVGAAGSHASGCKQTGIHLCYVVLAAHLPFPTHFLRSPDTGAKGISLHSICELSPADPIFLNLSFPLLWFSLSSSSVYFAP